MTDTSLTQSQLDATEPSAITILGSTGSIGQSTLNVIAANAERFSVYALTANTDVKTMLAQCQEFEPRYAVMVDSASAAELQQAIQSANLATEVLRGTEALSEVAGDPASSVVMAAIVGGGRAGADPCCSARREENTARE